MKQKRELQEVRVNAVALVDKGANRKPFFLVKRDEGGVMKVDLMKRYPWLGDKVAQLKETPVSKSLAADEKSLVANSMKVMNEAVAAMAELYGYPEPSVVKSESRTMDEMLAEVDVRVRPQVEALIKAHAEVLKLAPEKLDGVSKDVLEKAGDDIMEKVKIVMAAFEALMMALKANGMTQGYPSPSYPAPGMTKRGEIDGAYLKSVSDYATAVCKVGATFSQKNVEQLMSLYDTVEKMLLENGALTKAGERKLAKGENEEMELDEESLAQIDALIGPAVAAQIKAQQA